MLISVIIPVYNVEKYIKRCVESVLQQSFGQYELILVDDGSTDLGGQICEEYATENRNIHVLHKENGGLSEARNMGIDWAVQNSDSSWITFLDGDDWIHRDYLKELYEAAVTMKEDISICGFVRTSGNETGTPQKDAMRRWKTEDFFVEKNVNAVVAWGKLYKKELWKQIRYPCGKLHEDEFTTYRILFQRETVAVVEKSLYYYYQNEQGIMNSAWSLRRLDVLEAMEERIRFFEERKYQKAFEWNINAALRCCYWNYLLASRDMEGKERKKCLRKIKKEFRSILKRYARCGFLEKEETEYEYHKMFPVKSFFYEYAMAFNRKIQKIRQGGMKC